MRKRWPIALVAVLVGAVSPPACGPVPAGGGAAHEASRLDVRFVVDEPEAVLDILDAMARGEEVGSAAWARLFATEGYRRLKEREASLNRAFTDDEFGSFVRSPALAERRTELRRTLERWRSVDMAEPARLAFRYLPEGAAIRAAVYPSIKPRTNSFVFEPRTNPAIFLYLDPAKPAAALTNTVAHELHHIGLAGACGDPDPGLPKGVRDALDWMGGFGEGLAMLAAAGGADTHPHATSPSEARAVWDSAVARVPADLARLERFFLDLVDGRMTEEEAATRGFRFLVDDGVPQGAFYTVGWHMAALVERELGRERVVAGVCDPAVLLADYDRAAAAVGARTGRRLPRWSGTLLEAVGAGSAVEQGVR
ncbi:MAG TPA: DUF5700 domain-containing putative Zn-dependent protease [Longimicrobiales bacterium]|nr:DUF5700 domain-containing putative Zn-dependent protease [Longimicrobiales bacterium]